MSDYSALSHVFFCKVCTKKSVPEWGQIHLHTSLMTDGTLAEKYIHVYKKNMKVFEEVFRILFFRADGIFILLNLLLIKRKE